MPIHFHEFHVGSTLFIRFSLILIELDNLYDYVVGYFVDYVLDYVLIVFVIGFLFELSCFSFCSNLSQWLFFSFFFFFSDGCSRVVTLAIRSNCARALAPPIGP